MNTPELGIPDLQIAGLSIWIHGREFPEANDSWDGNWLRSTIACTDKDATVKVSAPVFMVQDIARWMSQCETLYHRMSGVAELAPLEPNLLVTIRPRDQAKHLVKIVEITPDHLTQQHQFEFEIDQTFLPPLILQCKKVVAEYPLK